VGKKEGEENLPEKEIGELQKSFEPQ